MKAKHMRLLVLLAVVMLLVSMIGVAAYATEANPAAEPVCYEHGDVNADGEISGEDAVYLLFASLYQEEYPLGQNGDIDENDQFDGDDAVYLLFASLYEDEYPLKGTVHSYYDPLWTWDTQATTPTAQVSLKCACGEPHTVTEGITVTPGTVIEPTCVAMGSKEYTATVTYKGAVFTDTVTITLDAKGVNGHEFSGAATCADGVKCNNCDYTLPALGHNYALLDTETVDGCKHTKRYKCTVCQKEIDGTAEGDVYYTHNYTAKIVKEATCSVMGEKLHSCACGANYSEDIEKNDSHTWVRGNTENGVTTYACACGQTKTVVEVAKDQDIAAEALKDNEVQLEGGTTVALDEKTADQLDANKTVKITVEAVKVDEVQLEGNQQLDADTKEQIGQNDIYDFSMTYSDGTPISEFEGLVTVALPYTLQDGDDVNSIDVWYIADDGNVECVKGVYSNGYVTFQTDHFSYYTVTRLTPAQRCAVYGHVELQASKAATCTEDGYTKTYCQRCAAEISYEKITMLGHDYAKDTAKSKAATCNAAGIDVEVCQRCNHEKSEELKQLAHAWEKTETVAAGCTNKGYDKYVCELCNKEKIENEKEALGHAWGVADNGWQWSEDKSKATLTLTCANGSHDAKVLSAVITKEGEPSVCLGGNVTYTAKVHFNKPYENTVVDVQTGLGHTSGNKWEADSTQHYQLCTVCGEKLGAADHQWKQTVNTAATCGKPGSATDKCAVCDEEKSVVLPATGEHTYVKGVCSGCGKKADTCDHTLTEEVIDLSKFGACPGSLTIRSCACGAINVAVDSQITCDLEVLVDGYDEEADAYVYKEKCKVCGLVQQTVEGSKNDEDACTSTYGYESSLIMNDTVLASASHTYNTSFHPAAVEHETINFADYGMCGGVWQRMTCYCGTRTYYDVIEETKCRFDDETGVCSACGTTLKYTYTGKEQGCSYFSEDTYIYIKNGTTVLSLTDQYIETHHNYLADGSKLYGETCADGVVVNRRCAVCGETDVRYYETCSCNFVKEKIDTTGVGFCTDTLVIYTCPCGSRTDYSMEGEGYHNWTPSHKENGVEYATCEKCGYTRAIKRTESEKNANCQVFCTVELTFSDDEGHSFNTTYQYTEKRHDIETTFVLKGDSCEDGVEITQTCKDCNYSDKWNSYYHTTFEVDRLDLSDYGFCGGSVYTYACACGEEANISGLYSCNWEVVGYQNTEQGEIYTERCGFCGITREQLIVRGEATDPCHRIYTRSYKFYKDTQLLGQIGYTYKESNHRYVHQLTLNPGATDCSGGYTYVATCVECGEEGNGNGSGCGMYIVAREMVSADLCGQLEKLTYSCACGDRTEVQAVWVSDETCVFQPQGYDETLQAQIFVCETCGASQYHKNTVIPGDPACKYQQKEATVWLDKAGDVLLEAYSIYNYTNHIYVCTFTLNGETCADGYVLNRTCLYCGLTSSRQEDSDCNTYLVGREQVYDNDAICGAVYVDHYSCACGAEESYSCDANNHSFVWVDGVRRSCRDCGLIWNERYDYERIPKSCRVITTREDAFILDGETVATVTKSWEETEHVIVYTYTLNGDSCEDGYTYTERCAYCDYSSESSDIHYEHDRWRTEYYELPEGSCGGHISLRNCACGQHGSMDYEYGCEWSGYDPEGEEDDDSDWYRCNECGLIEQFIIEKVESADPCERVYNRIYKLYRDDQVLVNWSYIDTQDNHRYEYTFTLNSEDAGCIGGWTARGTCVTCGATTEGYNMGCSQHVIDREIVSTDDMCGQLEKRLTSCACGEYTDTELTWISDESCVFESQGYDEALQAEKYVCDACGSYYYQTYTREPVEGATCEYRTKWTYSYYNKAGQFLAEDQSIGSDYDHEYLYSYEMYGDTCADGYDVYWRCADCGMSGIYDTGRTDCSTYRISRELVYENEALCGSVYLNHYRCACGANESYSCSTANHTWIDGGDTCADCGLIWNERYDYERIPKSCRVITTREETFTLDGEVVATVEKSWERTEHIYVHTYHMMGDSCEDGYTYTERCVYCDYSYDSTDIYYDHNRWTTQYYDLPDDSCGGYIYFNSCACGKESNINYSYACECTGQSWSETDKDGILHEYNTYTCKTCGMSYSYEYYRTAGENACEQIVHQDCTFKVGDWEKHFVERYTIENHDYQVVSVKLQEGATDCEDGVCGVQRCADCAKEVEFTSEGHYYRNVIKTIDLSQYGSNCGATLNLMLCPCGKYQSYEFSKDSLCDLDEKVTDHWITGVIDKDQYTSEGYVETYSDSYIYTCAVTDPACGLKIRMSRYWLNENCTAVQYETWQLGYDPQTGTCLEEITIATGNEHGYHPYEYTDFEETVDGARNYGGRYVCPDCGSTYTYTYYHNAEDQEIKYVTEAVNTLANGENKKWTETWEYAYYFGCQFTTLERSDWVYADDSIYWRQNVWTYDFTEDCTGTRVYIDSDGDTDTYEEEAHYTPCNDIKIKDSTCTQYGEYVDRHVCSICDKLVSESTYRTNPTAHNWYKDEEKGTYYCYTCGLESENGASGAIVLEDLTDAYTEGNYVIGYWNRGEVAFSPYVSLVLYDVAEGENDELVLTDIDFTYLTVKNDGICGLEFNQEAVAAAAAAAIEETGYIGEYAVRISFVPVNSADTLDYAITFETLTAE